MWRGPAARGIPTSGFLIADATFAVTREPDSPRRRSRKPASSFDIAEDVTVERATFARNFRAARIAAKLIQQEVHVRTGLAQSYISEVERCIINPSLDQIAKMSHAIGRPLHELLKP
jgi:hypothetical protein